MTSCSPDIPAQQVQGFTFREMIKKIALLQAILLLLITQLTAIYLFDTAIAVIRRKKTFTAAAIAIRDRVPAYQKNATKYFSKRWLEKGYHRVVYIDNKDLIQQRELFISSLVDMSARYDSLDVFLLAHTNRMVEWVKNVDVKARQKIRLVYNSGCLGYEQKMEWKQLGVKYYLAHAGSYSLSPVFYFFFLKRWVSGYPLLQSVVSANQSTGHLLKLAGRSHRQPEESYGLLCTFYQ